MNHSMLISEFLSTPWAMQKERIAAFSTVLARKVSEKFSDEGFAKQSGFDARRQQAQSVAGSGSIAVLPLYGSIFPRANMMTDYCGGTSVQQFTAAFRECIANPSIGSILIDIDSPGGSVYGIQELGDEIYSARQKKCIVAVSNNLAASAAYWIGCQASEFYCTPSGEVGSIGVWQAHEDWSKAMELAGVHVEIISSGKYKVEGNPYQPLDEDARTFMQSRTDDYYGAFVKAVAKGRGTSVADVRDGMGQGRVLGSAQAKAEGMIDGVMTFDEVVKQMQASMKPAAKKASAENERLRLSLLG